MLMLVDAIVIVGCSLEQVNVLVTECWMGLVQLLYTHLNVLFKVIVFYDIINWDWRPHKDILVT